MAIEEAGSSLLFVYGTLKRGQINFPYWMINEPNDSCREVQFVCAARTVERYPLFVASNAFVNCSPSLLDVPGEGHQVAGDVFQVDARRRVVLDALEGVTTGLYIAKRIRVQRVPQRGPPCCGVNGPSTDTMEVWVYFRAKKFDEDWRITRPLLTSFSAVRCLTMEPRSYDSLPAHRRFENLDPPPCAPKPMVLVILDGIGDVQCAELQHRTPLHAAAAAEPWLNVVTRHGVSGLMDPYAPGTACGSDTAHLSMLGYDPAVYYRGRGAFESLGAGMTMVPDEDVAFKCNFSVTDDAGPPTKIGATGRRTNKKVVFRRCDREFTAEGPVLCAALDGLTLHSDLDGAQLEHGPHVVRVRYATEHRCGVVITGKYLSDRITGTDPLSDGLDLLDCCPTTTAGAREDDEAAQHARAVYTCRVVMAASEAMASILHSHPINAARVANNKRPANIVLLRGASMRNDIPSFERRHGLKGFMVAPTCIIRGLGACCGLDIVESAGGTGDYHSNILGKAEAVVRAFGQCDASRDSDAEVDASGRAIETRRMYQFGVLHVKATDDAGHDGDPLLKARMLRGCAVALEYLWKHLETGSTIAVTGDHTTICAMEDHATEPVPISIGTIPARGARGDVDDGGVSVHGAAGDSEILFSEIDCALHGQLGRFRGEDLIDVMKAVHFRYPLC